MLLMFPIDNTANTRLTSYALIKDEQPQVWFFLITGSNAVDSGSNLDQNFNKTAHVLTGSRVITQPVVGVFETQACSITTTMADCMCCLCLLLASVTYVGKECIPYTGGRVLRSLLICPAALCCLFLDHGFFVALLPPILSQGLFLKWGIQQWKNLKSLNNFVFCLFVCLFGHDDH